jgi:uncharacterized protein YegP (UPF0339 family)
VAKFEVKPDAKGERHWHLRASNGRIVADSGEGYKDRDECLAGIRIVKTEAPVAEIIFL